jgi:hypothetical protein
MGKQLVIHEEARVPRENHQPWASRLLPPIKLVVMILLKVALSPVNQE